MTQTCDICLREVVEIHNIACALVGESIKVCNSCSKQNDDPCTANLRLDPNDLVPESLGVSFIE